MAAPRKGVLLLNPTDVNSLFSKRGQQQPTSKEQYLAKCPQAWSDKANESFVISESGPPGPSKIDGCAVPMMFVCTFQSP